MSSKWFAVEQPKTDEERTNRKIMIENSYATLRLLDQIFEQEIAQLERQQQEAFDKPNFAENQARILGSLRTLRELRTLTPKIRKE